MFVKLTAVTEKYLNRDDSLKNSICQFGFDNKI